MHIPDGLMAPLPLLIGWIISLLLIALSIRVLKQKIEDTHIPLMAVLAAGVFVAQMLNFPIGGGTTGHLVGAALLAILLGPFAGIIILTTILIIQCFLFGDGGLTALGLNILNMAVIGCLAGYGFHKIFPMKYQKIGIFLASWLAVFLGALACSLELAFSYSVSGGTYGIPAVISIPTMLGYHTLIGIGEAIITTGILTYINQVSPDLLKIPKITLRKKPEAAIDV